MKNKERGRGQGPDFALSSLSFSLSLSLSLSRSLALPLSLPHSLNLGGKHVEHFEASDAAEYAVGVDGVAQRTPPAPGRLVDGGKVAVRHLLAAPIRPHLSTHKKRMKDRE